jgi:carbamoyltransferase
MLFAFAVHPEKRAVIPAVTHADGSARVQTVSRKTNPLFWSLIRAFSDITGIPVVLNTSFNVKNEPIVCTPDHAIACFLSTNLDALAIGHYLVTKR